MGRPGVAAAEHRYRDGVRRIRALPSPLLRVVALLAPTLLGALAATQVFGGDRELVVDARALGLAAASLALLARLPPLALVVIAAAVTALARAL